MMINPILRNEIKTEGRRFKFYLLIMLYPLLIGVPTVLIFNAIIQEPPIKSEDFIGLYVFLVGIQAFILMFIVPALSASLITEEREKQTLDILLTTHMTPRRIIIGKLLSVVSKVILLIVCTLPVYGLMLFLGGIKLLDLLACNGFLMMTTIFVASLCILISTVVKTSKAANVISYLVELGLIIAYPIGLIIWYGISLNQTNIDLDELIACLMNFSPAVGYLDLVFNQIQGEGFAYNLFGGNFSTLIPGYMISIIMEVILSVVFLEIATRRLNPRREVSKRKSKKLAQKVKHS